MNLLPGFAPLLAFSLHPFSQCNQTVVINRSKASFPWKPLLAMCSDQRGTIFQSIIKLEFGGVKQTPGHVGTLRG